MSDERHARYEAKRVQVAQIKCVDESDEHRRVTAAIEKLRREHGYGSAREAFVESLLIAAEKVREKP